MNIKVCGVNSFKQLQQLDGLNVDFAGLIFVKDSPRYIEGVIETALVKDADLDLKKVGVFVNPEMIDVLDAIDNYKLDVIQLHGNETPEMCDDLSSEVEVIKVFSIDANTKDIDDIIAPYDAVCDYYLFDNKGTDGLGGSGQKFDWKKIAGAKIEKPFFLSGGIGPDDAALVKKFKHPDFFGVDLNSLFEKEPGVKDMGLVLKFIHGLK
jgi:phosphoribosylanthranilate isomerase